MRFPNRTAAVLSPFIGHSVESVLLLPITFLVVKILVALSNVVEPRIGFSLNGTLERLLGNAGSHSSLNYYLIAFGFVGVAIAIARPFVRRVVTLLRTRF